MRVDVSPAVLLWARERADVDPAVPDRRWPKLAAWLAGEIQPTLKQLERFAAAVHAPIGAFFLTTPPPPEPVPIPDFRTLGNGRIGRPTPDLLDTVYQSQQRQEWYRDFARAAGEEPRPFIGAATVRSDVVATATAMREALGFDLDERRRMGTWDAALRRFIEQADAIGVLVLVNGVVGNNNTRKLDPQEFRSFALKVSTLVILRVMHDAGLLPAAQFWQAYRAELDRIDALPASSGGSFYLSVAARVGKRFARALIVSTLEGETLYRDAYRMLGLSKPETFRKLGESLGVA